MDRQQVIAKIQSILKLQKGTDFEGEASAAANLIDKLCKQYNVTLDEATETQVFDETFMTFKRINQAYATLLNAVAYFYDAKAYLKTDDVKSIQIIGSEAQQIQVRLYYDYLLEVMEKECKLAHEAEKVIASVSGNTISRSFKTNFKKAFSNKVALRLHEMKEAEKRTHEDADAVKNKLVKMKFNSGRKFTSAKGDGACVGAEVGAGVSLNRQASGSTVKSLVGV